MHVSVWFCGFMLECTCLPNDLVDIWDEPVYFGGLVHL